MADFKAAITVSITPPRKVEFMRNRSTAIYECAPGSVAAYAASAPTRATSARAGGPGLGAISSGVKYREQYRRHRRVGRASGDAA